MIVAVATRGTNMNGERCYYDEDLEYYVQEAIQDLKEKNKAVIRDKLIYRLNDGCLYEAKHIGGEKRHDFIKLEGDEEAMLRDMILKANGYGPDLWHNEYLYLTDAEWLMSKGHVVTHFRYGGVEIKMVDGQMVDHWPDTDEPDMWYDYDVSKYSDGDRILTSREYVGWDLVR